MKGKGYNLFILTKSEGFWACHYLHYSVIKMANVDDARHLQVFKLDGRRNKMEFISGFPGVAARFGIEGIIYDGTPRPGAAEELAEARANWDRLNRLALEKLRFYVSTRVDDIVTDGEDLTARQYILPAPK